ncbi:MAG: FtsX-like permease family protein [Bacteroidetes bacterium]|nr:FtsX-like permease family protein [Bacteroidota bacterium]
MFKNYLKITWKVLKRKKVYTIVTMAGIIIPVTFIVLITSFLVHINNYNPPKSGFKNVVYLDWVTWKEIKEDGNVNQRSENPPTYSFINNYVKTLNSPKLVSAVSVNFFSGSDIIYMNDNPNEVNIKYSDSEFWEITDFKFIHGRPYNKSEFEQGARVVVIDEKTSRSFFGTTNAAGKSLEIKNKLFRVIGVVKNVDITMFRIWANIYLPYSCLDNYLSNSMYLNFSRALILTNNLGDFQKIDNEFQQKLTTVSFENAGNLNHIEASFKQDNYLERIKDLAFTFFRYYGDVKKPLYLAGALLFFFFIILPAINLVNININRVYERLSEIGVRKTFGATTSRLIGQFLFENILIILTGGIFSILLSGLIILFINKTNALSGIYLTINFKAVAFSLLAIFILSILSGLMPSIGMARAKIIQSLNSSETK